MSIGTTINDKPQVLKSEPMDKVVPTKNEESSIDVLVHDHQIIVYEEPKQNNLMVPSPRL